MFSLRIVERELVRTYQTESVPRAEHNSRASIRTAITQWSEPSKQGSIDSLRFKTRKHLAQKVSLVDERQRRG